MTQYRYALLREWLGNGGLLNWIMLNPSTADEVRDDPTIRRCIGFAKRWGFSSLAVTNLFAYRATVPKDLIDLARSDRVAAIGADNDRTILAWAAKADLIVCAWGDNCDNAVLFHRDLDVISTLRHRDLYCIRKTKRGNPVHPVREAYIEKPELFCPRLVVEASA